MAAWYGAAECLPVPVQRGGVGPAHAPGDGVRAPPIAALWGGTAEFADASCCYPLDFRLEPAGEFYTGLGAWAVPTHGGMVRQLRAVPADPVGAAEIGRRTAARAAEFTWGRTARALHDALAEFDLLPAK